MAGSQRFRLKGRLEFYNAEGTNHEWILWPDREMDGRLHFT